MIESLETLVEPAVSWATADGPPNWMFALALLTTPALWSRRATDAVKRRFGGQHPEAPDE